VAACGGGGGGGAATAVTGGGSGSSGGSGGGGNNILIRQPLDRASVGSNPLPLPLATAGNPGFATTQQALSGTAFPLVEDIVSVRPTSSQIGQATSIVAGGATLTARDTGFELTIPRLGIDVTLPGDGSGTMVSTNSSIIGPVAGTVSLALSPHNYLTGGLWIYTAANSQDDTSAIFAPFITGFVTPEGNIPRVGTAIYTAAGGLIGVVFVRSGSGLAAATLEGDVSLTATFSTGAITGFANHIVAAYNGSSTTWNDIAFAASIEPSSGPRNSFRGTTTVSSAPGTAYSLKGNAIGKLTGYFFGPNLGEVGGVWSLGNTDDTGAAYGIIGGELTGGAFPAGNRVPYFLSTLPNPSWATASTPIIATPLAATIDSTTNPSLFASAGGPTFSGSGSFGTAQMFFPIRETALEFTAGGMSASADSTNARIILDSWDPMAAQVTSYSLTIPAESVNKYTGTGDTPFFSTPFASTSGSPVATFGLSYAAFGAWLLPAGDGTPVNTGYFSFGLETPVSAVPTSGTATYSESGGVVGTAFVRSGNSVSEAVVGGDAALTAHFGSGNVTGNFTHMNTYTQAQTAPWNDVSISASIAAGSNSFSGSTAAASAPGGSFALKNSATGHIDGAFYGPNANELGAVWTLSNGDGSGSAIGVVGAARH
jgi:hypothetical protein